MDGLLETLRTSCRPMHQQVEQTFLLTSLVNRTIHLPHYRMLIQAMYEVCCDFYPYLQRNLQQTEFTNFVSPACRVSELKRDLHLLGQAVNYTPNPLMNVEDDLEVALGAMYVLLGSANGAQYLAKLIDQNPHEEVKRARHFFSHDSEGRLVTWRAFIEKLGNLAFNSTQQTKIATSALNTFYLIKTKLDIAVVADGSEVKYG